MKIAIFGGSFNPLHNGHLGIINSLAEDKSIDEIWVVPCGNHSFDKALLSGKARLEMLNLAIDSPKTKILEYEIKKKEKSYSAEMLKDFKKEFPQDEFFLVIGADNLKIINKWHNFEYLKKETDFIVIARPGYELDNSFNIKIKKIIRLQNDLSSTKIRELALKEKPFMDFVPKKIYDYIILNKLYAYEK